MPQRLYIAALQPPLRWRQPMPNMITLRKMADELPSGVDVVVLPEMWTGMIDDHDVAAQAGQAAQFLQTLARACGIIVVGGSFQRPARSGRSHTGVFHTGVLHNVCLIVDRGGEIAGEYVKRTLFSHERDTHEPGSEAGVFEVDGFRIGVQICADLWWPERTRQLIDHVDVLCVPAKTAVPSDTHVVYARTLWHALALTRATESGLPVIVSDWAAGRHAPTDVDMSIGSVHARGTDFDRGVLHTRVLHKRHRDRTASPTAAGPTEPTATAHTSATPALGAGVHFTTGAASICNPAHRPDIEKLQRTLQRGEAGSLCEQIDLEAVAAFRDYRRRVGLLPDQVE